MRIIGSAILAIVPDATLLRVGIVALISTPIAVNPLLLLILRLLRLRVLITGRRVLLGRGISLDRSRLLRLDIGLLRTGGLWITPLLLRLNLLLGGLLGRLLNWRLHLRLVLLRLDIRQGLCLDRHRLRLDRGRLLLDRLRRRREITRYRLRIARRGAGQDAGNDIAERR